MEEVFEMKVQEKLQKLKDIEADVSLSVMWNNLVAPNCIPNLCDCLIQLNRRKDQMKRALEQQQKELAEKRKQFDEDKKLFDEEHQRYMEELEASMR